MKKSFFTVFLILASAGLIFLVTSFTITGNSQNNNEKYKILEKKVDSLSTRVAKLEKKVQSLEEQRYAFKMPGPYLHVPHGKVPKNWKQFWFNGMPYYMVPIQKDAEGKIQELDNKK